jgi:hypothetical protein
MKLITSLALLIGAIVPQDSTTRQRVGDAIRAEALAEVQLAEAQARLDELIKETRDQSAVTLQAKRDLAAAMAERKRSMDEFLAAIAQADPPVIVDPPPPPTTTWSHGYSTMTLELAISAARDRVDPILQAAPARTEKGFDVIYQELEDAGRNGFIAGESRHGRWGKSYGSPRRYDENGILIPRLVGLGMDNIWLSGPWDEESTGAKWFVRMSNLPSARFSRMRVVGSDLNGRNFPKEHGVYIDVSGSVRFINCLFEDLGGHGVYVNNRAYDFQQFGIITLPFAEQATWSCDNIVILNCEQDASRSAFNFTFNDAGSYDYPGTVLVQNCVSIQAWPFQRSQGTNDRYPITPYIQGYVRASGGMVVTNHDAAHMGGAGWPTESVTIEDSVFWTEQGRHSVLSLRGAESYLIKDSFIKASGPGHNSLIEIGSKDGIPGIRGPRTVVFENVVADGVRARIWRDSNNFEIVDLHTLGVRQTWTPAGVTTENL